MAQVHQASVQALKMRNAVEGISPRWGEKDFVGTPIPGWRAKRVYPGLFSLEPLALFRLRL
jgi:hypothetical protein